MAKPQAFLASGGNMIKQVDFVNRHKKIIDKKYRHFDPTLTEGAAIKFSNQVIFNPDNVRRYRFFPIINYLQHQKKYRRRRGRLRAHIKDKVRPIALVAHRDALVFAAYADKLQQPYENYLINHELVKLPTAYRKKLRSSNIGAAKEVFDFIVDCDGCWIIKGDFRGFFDNVRHRILLKNLCNVLGVEKLSPDWQAVYKAITKYRYVMSEDLNKAIKLSGLKNNGDGPYISERRQIKELQDLGKLKIHGPNQIGIPQGTSLSAMLANVYMIEFDETMLHVTKSVNGLYRRYSDDFVVVVPKKRLNTTEVNAFVKEIISTSHNLTNLVISEEKTKIFAYNRDEGNSISLFGQVPDAKKAVWFDYLGFIFNGHTVRMRDKGIYKFHYRGKKAINRFLRIENDREKIAEGKWNPNTEKQRIVWHGGDHIFQTVTQVPKKIQYQHRMQWTIENMNRNSTESKIATKMYLSGRRYGEEFSMVGYAKRAQSILENNHGKYDVEVLSQILRQLRKNQLRVNSIRKNNDSQKLT